MTGIQSVSISPEGLRDASFSTENYGYDRDEVRSLLASAADALELAWREKNDLTASMTADDGDISSRAVLLLSNAQRIADDAVAEAEAYSRDLIETARNQYREIIERAQTAAHDLERQAGVSGAGAAPVPASTPAPSAPAPSAPAPDAAAAAPTAGAWSPDQSPVAAFATDDLDAAGTASPSEVIRARQFTRMAAAQAHSLLESIERELARLGKNPGGPAGS